MHKWLVLRKIVCKLVLRNVDDATVPPTTLAQALGPICAPRSFSRTSSGSTIGDGDTKKLPPAAVSAANTTSLISTSCHQSPYTEARSSNNPSATIVSTIARPSKEDSSDSIVLGICTDVMYDPMTVPVLSNKPAGVLADTLPEPWKLVNASKSAGAVTIAADTPPNC